MSRLRIYDETAPEKPSVDTNDHARIAEELCKVGVGFERWKTIELPDGAAPEVVIDAYRDDIDRLMREGGYKSCDVVSLAANHAQKDQLRRKFLDEHTHSEDEVRFFVAGEGLFTLHIGDQVYEVLCTKGDLIRVPHDTRHWFDMGEHPSFIAIRLFTDPAGWVANFTGDEISRRFPRHGS